MYRTLLYLTVCFTFRFAFAVGLLPEPGTFNVPSTCVTKIEGEKCAPTSISWNIPNVTSVCLVYLPATGPEKNVACKAANSSHNIDWFISGNAYKFIIRVKEANDETLVGKETSAKVLNANPENYVVANTLACAVQTSGKCDVNSVTVSWNSVAAAPCVFVEKPDGSSKVNSCAKAGSVKPDWIAADTYAFVLRETSNSTSKELARVLVYEKNQGSA